MKNYMTWCLLFLLTACSTPATRNDAGIRFNEQEHDFGSLAYKKAVEYQFEFTNPGETPLVITDVKTSCGCTAARWTGTPVKTGKSGMINIGYDAEFPGIFSKEISVRYNGPDSPVVLKIKGEVRYPDNQQAKN
ncbi:MAG: DUF1573 domain-containing protein [Mangrovibacterium sp.]